MPGMQAVYTIGELAALAGISCKRMAARLRGAGVRVRSHGRGRPRTVCLTQIKRAWPDLWDSLVLRATFSEGS